MRPLSLLPSQVQQAESFLDDLMDLDALTRIPSIVMKDCHPSGANDSKNCDGNRTSGTSSAQPTDGPGFHPHGHVPFTASLQEKESQPPSSPPPPQQAIVPVRGTAGGAVHGVASLGGEWEIDPSEVCTAGMMQTSKIRGADPSPCPNLTPLLATD